MASRPSGANRWEDHYTRQARRERFPARSVYKLKEIQKRFAVIRPGDRVLDLGCAPGSWLLLAAELAGPSGRVAGIDLSPVVVALPGHAAAAVMDVHGLDEGALAALGAPFDVVLSDMAPATTGSRGVDAARSHGLCQAALGVARRALRPGGAFVCKIFQGEDFESFVREVRGAFAECRIFKPQSSRKASREIYVVGKGRR
jgi:23S rRNA (uridine2552-2'-O)-methyltransferase